MIRNKCGKLQRNLTISESIRAPSFYDSFYQLHVLFPRSTLISYSNILVTLSLNMLDVYVRAGNVRAMHEQAMYLSAPISEEI